MMAHGNTGNKYAVGNNGGRPPVYETPEQLQARVEEYFTWIQGESHIEEKSWTDKKTGEVEVEDVEVWDRHPERPTITGLALFLGFDSKQSLYDYKKKSEFSYPIKRGLTIIEQEYEFALFNQSSSGAIFALKNMDWKDKTEQEITKVKSKVSFKDEPSG